MIRSKKISTPEGSELGETGKKIEMKKAEKITGNKSQKKTPQSLKVSKKSDKKSTGESEEKVIRP